jgi:CRISPR system Cascade subunit CasE
MNYLTRVFVDYETAAMRRIHDAYDWHQRVWDAFPHLDRHGNDRRPKGTPRFFLTRLDEDERRGGYRLYILSATAPVRPAWCPDHEHNWATKQIKGQFLEHTRYRFSLRANPAKKVTPKGPDGLHQGQGKRVPLREITDLRVWMERKAEAGGFEVEPGTLRVTPRGLQHFSIEKERRLGTVGAVDFDGLLRVRNHSAFKDAFANGIGSAKAFGFGLLLLEPLDGKTNPQPERKENP